MNEGPKSLRIVDDFLKKGLTDINLIYKSLIKRDDVGIPVVEAIVDNGTTSTLANAVVDDLNVIISPDEAIEIFEDVGNDSELGPAYEIAIAQDIKECDSPEDVEEVIDKIRENPKRHFSRYQEEIDERERKREGKYAST